MNNGKYIIKKRSVKFEFSHYCTIVTPFSISVLSTKVKPSTRPYNLSPLIVISFRLRVKINDGLYDGLYVLLPS
jgi:hypothetical protein